MKSTGRKGGASMTRKERKQQRRLKKFTRALDDDTKAYLKVIAKKMAQAPSPYIDGKHYCPICKVWYCNGYDGLIVYCADCYYKPGCIRESRSFITCRRCL